MSTQPSTRLLIANTRLKRVTAPPRGSADTFIRDVELPGFGVRVKPTGTISFIVEARLHGKSKRKVLGIWSEEYGADEARADAKLELALWGKGEQGQSEIEGLENAPRLSDVLEEYIATRELKPRTIDDYRMVLDTGLVEWKDLPLNSITRDMVQRHHRKLGETSKSRANNAMRVLRALFNFAMAIYEDDDGHAIITENPVLRLKATRAWYRVPRRRTVIKQGELGDWYHAVQGLEGERSGANAEVARDFLLFLLFTGKRETEALNLEYDEVDLDSRIFVCDETKNWEEHALPMSGPVFEILDRRCADMGPWVFPSAKEPTEPLRDIRWWMAKITDASGVQFTLNDIRRTFITVAESLGLSGYTLKRLLNHKITEHDVTAGYIVSDAERLRDPMEQIAARILEITH